MEAISAVRRSVEAADLLPHGATIVVAVSGGIDSVVLFDLLDRLSRDARWKLVIAHFDHALRDGSADDASFVAALARSRGLAVVVERGKVRRAKGGLAQNARDARYEFLLRVAREHGASRIATGHTASDQAETLLLRLLRGTGAMGLAAIPPRRRMAEGIELVRPMLGLTRADVAEHARRFHLAWREDPSNRSVARTRNRIRHDVLPLLATIQPDVERVLARAATQSADSRRLLRDQARRAFRRVRLAEAPGSVTLSRSAWLALPAELGAHVVRLALSRVRDPHGVSAAHVEAVCAIARRGKGRAVLARASGRATAEVIVVEGKDS